MKKRNVLVTAVGGRSVGSGILHALTRSSKNVSKRWNIIAGDANPFSWGLYKVNDKVLLPLGNESGYIDAVLSAIKKFDIDAIIPGSEIETYQLAKSRDLINIPVIANNSDIMPLMLDKFLAYEKIIDLGYPSIPTMPLEKWEQLVELFGFPLIIKPTKGTGGSKGVKICITKKEIIESINFIDPDTGYCVQPLIGSEDDEYTVGVLSDKDGNIIDSIVMKRKLLGLSLLETRVANGNNHSISTGYSQGFIVRDDKIQNFCEELAIKLKSKGPLNIQLRIHQGKMFVFEIHPRFSGTSTIRADVGFNEPDILLRNFIDNEKFERLEYRDNVAAIRAFEHVIVPIDEMQF